MGIVTHGCEGVLICLEGMEQVIPARVREGAAIVITLKAPVRRRYQVVEEKVKALPPEEEARAGDADRERLMEAAGNKS
ncbi:MAG: hypothetical protein JL50_21295 [Peptococcaceae bacterium BICA1-7]|nr:MAG: hypothetical protein JL50_21295 [Peptococcaceae bacterium BICA1-7]HBV97135.1 hypothetical protein [Desulfotomaculum sp.]